MLRLRTRRFSHAHGRRVAAGRLLLVLVLALAAGAPPVAAQQATEKEIAESQRRLEQIRRERAQLREEMQRIQGRVHSMTGELRNLQRQVSSTSELLGELDFQVEQRAEQISQNTRDLVATQDILAMRRALLQRRLRDIYKRGPLHTTEVLLTAQSFSDLLNRYKYLFLVARHDRRLVHDVATLEAQLNGRERALRRSLLELQEVQLEKEREHEQLSALEQTQQRALTGMRRQERTTAQKISQLAADERRLSGMIATLERRRREAERRSTAAGETTAASTLTTRDLGNLAWPVEGRVLYRFGRVAQPNGTTLRRNGVGIRAAAGTRVRAVEEGTVVLAGPFEGYGPTVVISHGGGYYSLYLYLRDISVAEGDRVARSGVVGTVGGENTTEGAHMEFQIREPGGEAVDPLRWLQQRRAP